MTQTRDQSDYATLSTKIQSWFPGHGDLTAPVAQGFFAFFVRNVQPERYCRIQCYCAESCTRNISIFEGGMACFSR